MVPWLGTTTDLGFVAENLETQSVLEICCFFTCSEAWLARAQCGAPVDRSREPTVATMGSPLRGRESPGGWRPVSEVFLARWNWGRRLGPRRTLCGIPTVRARVTPFRPCWSTEKWDALQVDRRTLPTLPIARPALTGLAARATTRRALAAAMRPPGFAAL